MCGICGFVTNRMINRSELIDMNNQMVHRGPDDSGTEIFELQNGYRLGLGHRRLSILDLSELGHQPMFSSDKSIVIVYNGEIYNFMELKKQIPDYNFNSNCDTEVIIAAYQKWGINCLQHLNGMFAFALFDFKCNRLYLCRDRMGQKPLYYWLDGGNIVFASELKAIMKCPGFKKSINRNNLRKYLYHQYFTAPNTVFDNVFQLLPGAYLEYDGENACVNKYWDVAEQYHLNSKRTVYNYTAAKEELRKILIDSVKKRMMSDVPLGAFLSAGFDSTLVTAIAQEVSDEPINTFSIGFENENLNEAIFSKQISDYIGTNHHELYISNADMVSLVRDLPRYYDEPFADPSEIPTMLVSAMAKEKVTVALTGDGADELFCGYDWKYPMATKLKRVAPIGSIGRLLFNKKMISRLPVKVRAVLNNKQKSTRVQISLMDFSNQVEKMVDGVEEICKFDESKYYNRNWEEEYMLLDQDTYLPSILCKVDRASMKYSLECRSPFLDYRVVELSYRLPHSFKRNNKNGGKAIIKDILYDYVPKTLMDRPKHGFGAPYQKWLIGPLKQQLLRYGQYDYLKQQGVFNPEYTSEVITNFVNGSNHSNAEVVWSFFIFQQWYEYYMKEE